MHFLHYWNIYVALSKGRQSSMSLQLLSWSDIAAWCELFDVKLTRLELMIVRQIDLCFLRAMQTKDD